VGLEGRQILRRSPPAPELLRVSPKLPYLFDRRLEVGDDREGQAVEVRFDGGDGHRGFLSLSVVSRIRGAQTSARPGHARPLRGRRALAAPWRGSRGAARPAS